MPQISQYTLPTDPLNINPTKTDINLSLPTSPFHSLTHLQTHLPTLFQLKPSLIRRKINDNNYNNYYSNNNSNSSNNWTNLKTKRIILRKSKIRMNQKSVTCVTLENLFFFEIRTTTKREAMCLLGRGRGHLISWG